MFASLCLCVYAVFENNALLHARGTANHHQVSKESTCAMKSLKYGPEDRADGIYKYTLMLNKPPVEQHHESSAQSTTQ